MRFKSIAYILATLVSTALFFRVSYAATTSWDGKYSTEKIEVTVVYFLPKDRTPLPDWRERVNYYCDRITAFHAREFDGQSTLKTLYKRPRLYRQRKRLPTSKRRCQLHLLPNHGRSR